MQDLEITKIANLTPTKTNIEVVGAEMAEAVIEGLTDPLEFTIRCKFAIECLENALAKVKEIAIDKVGKETTLLGAKLEVAETGVKYDYSANNIWQQIDGELKPLLEKKKAIEDKIKMATKIGNSILDGDEIVASPVTKSSTTVLKITLGK